jgi:hypothetical protein
MLEKFKKYLIKGQNVPPYPPYHQGEYLEEYFFNFYLKHIEDFKKVKYQYLPVFWTDIYLYSSFLLNPLQDDLNSLDPKSYYFTVSQHDDAPYQSFPPNTLKFSAGGNIENTIPIPLICSPIVYNKELKEKDVFCSFVGSITSPISKWGIVSYNLRIQMLETLVNNKDYILKPKNWGPNVEKDRQDLFLDLTSRSKFTLCPRGYGATSFRLYEAIQLKSIPVYIYYEKPHLPFDKKIKWEDFCVLIDSKNMDTIDDQLKSINEEKYNQMITYGQEVYSKYFTLEGMCNGILETLKEI